MRDFIFNQTVAFGIATESIGERARNAAQTRLNQRRILHRIRSNISHRYELLLEVVRLLKLNFEESKKATPENPESCSLAAMLRDGFHAGCKA